jgi:serine/threonine protein kinase
MKEKTKEYYLKRGFKYEGEAEHLREFALAKAYFELHPTDIIKIRKKDWVHVLNELSMKRPDLELDIQAARDSLPKHSYLYKKDAANPEKKKVWALGAAIARGSFGRVKHSMDEDGIHTVNKIEKFNDSDQQREERIARDIGILVSNKIRRLGGKSGTEVKYYTGAVYLGQDLYTIGKKLNYDEWLDVLRKVAWELHRLHTGAASISRTAYVHRDLKPENIMVAPNGKVSLTDFGLSKELFINKKSLEEAEVKFVGTHHYLPTEDDILLNKKVLIQWGYSRSDNVYGDSPEKIATMKRMKLLGLRGIDVFALKRIAAESLLMDHWEQLNNELKRMIYILPINRFAMQRKDIDTALNMTIGFIEQKMHIDSKSLLDLDQQSKQLIGESFSEIDKLEELSFGKDDYLSIKEQAVALRAEVIASSSNIASLTQCFQRIKHRCFAYELNESAYRALPESVMRQLEELASLVDLEDNPSHGFIQTKQEALRNATTLDALHQIAGEVAQGLAWVKSDEMLEVTDKIKKFRENATKPGVSGSAATEKANKLATAVYQVPFDERTTVISTHPHVQQALAFSQVTSTELKARLQSSRDSISEPMLHEDDPPRARS